MVVEHMAARVSHIMGQRLGVFEHGEDLQILILDGTIMINCHQWGFP